MFDASCFPLLAEEILEVVREGCGVQATVFAGDNSKTIRYGLQDTCLLHGFLCQRFFGSNGALTL